MLLIFILAMKRKICMQQFVEIDGAHFGCESENDFIMKRRAFIYSVVEIKIGQNSKLFHTLCACMKHIRSVSMIRYTSLEVSEYFVILFRFYVWLQHFNACTNRQTLDTF